MEKREDDLPDSYEMCCGKRRCPTISRKGDGAVLSDVLFDELGNEYGPSITLTADQARELKRWLEQKGF